MGFFNNLFAKSPLSSIAGTTDTIAKHYLMLKASSPNLPEKEIYKQIIEFRYSRIPLKEEWRYQSILDYIKNISNLKELIFEILTNESPDLLRTGNDNLVTTLNIIQERLDKEYKLK